MKPRLSVVVPIFNVEDYLEECLRSIAEQTVRDLEVVLVDDGSTDTSGVIAEKFAAADPRFRYIRQENAGLSAARNTGVRHATSAVPYLTFADSDDIVVHDAYERMLASLESTGSDFATGNVWRLDGQGRHQAWQYKWLAAGASRERTHITRDPQLLADRVAWNKVFRRSFWDRHHFAFPEGKLYEDTPVMIPAHYRAEAVDVLADHVYYWRVREGSITQRRTDVKGVRDRIDVCAEVSRFLGAERSAEEKRTYDVSCLRDDFVYFLEGLPMGGPEYREAFMTGAAAFLGAADASIAGELPVDLRIKWRLVREGRLPELLEVLLYEQEHGKGTFAVRGLPWRRRAAFPGVDATERLRPSELPSAVRLLGAEWQPDGRLLLHGTAGIRNLKAGRGPKLGMAREVGGRRMRRVPLQGGKEPDTFDMVVDPLALPVGEWLLGVVVVRREMVRRAAVRPVEASAAQPLVKELGHGWRGTLDFRDGRASVTVGQCAARVDAHRLDGDRLEVTGQLFGTVRPMVLRIQHPDGEREFSYHADGSADTFSARIPLKDLTAAPARTPRLPKEVAAPRSVRWRARLVLPDGTELPVAARLGLAPGRYGEVCATADPAGELQLEATRQAIADVLRWERGALHLAGTHGGSPSGELELRSGETGEVTYAPVSRDGSRFTASVEPPPDGGRWHAYLDGMPLRVLTPLGASLPTELADGERRFTATRRDGDHLVIDAEIRRIQAPHVPQPTAEVRQPHDAAQTEPFTPAP
ncbi:glycosyltransferase [Streptomyces sp. NPDC050738]|uniref:glycosyltransferase n=1 Tax=Streptomyces sp. NPDC050738 TaxID=3154744 RepID=UPI003432C87A